jgi:hypothetical protein
MLGFSTHQYKKFNRIRKDEQNTNTVGWCLCPTDHITQNAERCTKKFLLFLQNVIISRFCEFCSVFILTDLI